MYPCFFIEQIAVAQRALIVTEDGTCPNFSCHRIEVRLDEFKWPLDIELNDTCHIDPQDASYPWPTQCACGYQLTDKQSRSSMVGRKWVRKDTGETHLHIRDFGIGAMWYATWWKGKKLDGTQLYGWDWDNQTTPPLCVQTPGGTWNIDERASNCTLKDDKQQHRCWVRHGEPPNITVDKNGLTCGAGGGSIICGDYHGFLQNGQLT